MTDKLEYIVVCQSAWCNPTGYGIHYGWDGERHPDREAAIKDGFEIRESDDFNVAVVQGKRLISFDWMYKSVGNDDDAMAEIAKALDLKFKPGRRALSTGGGGDA